MDIKTLTGQFSRELEALIEMSTEAGRRVDYIQGGGGNTSVKFDDKLMAIKASGYRLDQIATQDGYAVLDYAAVRSFYMSHSPSDFEDVEKEGSAVAKTATQEIEGMKALRPSVEVGFHSTLSKYVLHSHSYYANMACCAENALELCAQAMEGLEWGWCFIPYINPGAALTFAMSAACKKAEQESGKPTKVIFMQNHGLVATDDDMAACRMIHDRVNKALADGIGKDSMAQFPSIKVKKAPGQEDVFFSDSPRLAEMIRQNAGKIKSFIEEFLYPDQMVYLGDGIELCDGSFDGKATDTPCTIYLGSGEIVYRGTLAKAQTTEETLGVVVLIRTEMERIGRKVQMMGQAGKEFISGWESEKYRKSLTK